MEKITTKQLEHEFERYCDRCLLLAVKEYLNRAYHAELRDLKARIELLLESPCKTPECLEDCSVEGVKDEDADI